MRRHTVLLAAMTAAALWLPACTGSTPVVDAGDGDGDGDAVGDGDGDGGTVGDGDGDGDPACDAVGTTCCQPDPDTDGLPYCVGGLTCCADNTCNVSCGGDGDGDADAGDGDGDADAGDGDGDADGGMTMDDAGVDAGPPVPDTETCCDGVCAEAAGPTQCPACEPACTADIQYCSSAGCGATVWPGLCGNENMVAFKDGIFDDDAATQAMAAAVTAACADRTVRVVPQPEVDAYYVDTGSTPIAGRPRIGVGYTAVLAGGSFYQEVVGYLEARGTTAVYDASDDGNLRIATNDGNNTVLFQVPTSELAADAGRDAFVVELVFDDESGAVFLIAYGFYGRGTRAAAWYVENVLLPEVMPLSSPAPLYRVVEWNDADGGDGAPSADDTFTVLAPN